MDVVSRHPSGKASVVVENRLSSCDEGLNRKRRRYPSQRISIIRGATGDVCFYGNSLPVVPEFPWGREKSYYPDD